ncbi:MAG TPA: response regulator transcription factor [Verrucomicrobiota bacterium]|nr:DNA-binding response regulator [Verrucomicrobiales bacterium]HRI15486.1 response regulator transcription factor [Verrucomicrobiota bacterium]
MSATTSIAHPRVLVIDDEPPIRRLLTLVLEANGYRVTAAENGKEGLVLAAQLSPALIFLDLGLPDLPGADVLRRLREWSTVPVIIVTAQDTESEKVALLDAGADDYITKPFNTAELLARVRVALRRASHDTAPPVFQAGRLVVDLAMRRVEVQGREVTLTATEYALLKLFVRHAGRVLTHRQILREVWGPTAESQTHYLRVYVARLREKLEAGSGLPQLFRTEPGVGYRLLEGPTTDR